MSWYLEALRKYAQFDGRARRSEYWFFSLFTVVIYILLLISAAVIGGLTSRGSHPSPLVGIFVVPAILFVLGMIIPHIAVTVRRLHDTGRSGWWYFISFIPLVGGILLLVFLLLDSEPGPNLYGQSPKYSGGNFNMGYPFPPPPYPPQS